SPWESYQEDWRLGRHNTVTVAYKKSKQDQMYTVRGISKSQARRNLEMIRQLHHKNLVPIHEVFASQQGFFIISPYMDISLERINGSPRYPCELQLAELSREILYGISYLASEGWTHSNINCSNILLSLKDAGGAKITGIECCSKSAKGDAGGMNSKALGIVMMKVMEKDSQPKGAFGLRYPERWSEDAVEFLSMTQVST
ncbi:kinase-like domain-containing protein, partial [Tricladium varicosporioides]